MELAKAKEILALVADGIHPGTGEVYPADSVYQDPMVIRALYTVIKALDKVKDRSLAPKQLPNAGTPWTTEHEQELLSKFNQGIEIKELATQMGRTQGAVTARLVKLGLLSPQENGFLKISS